MTTTPRLGITQLEEDQALPEAVVNEGDLILEGFATRAILKSKGDNSPPGSPAEGDMYLIGGTGTGAWTGHDNQLAQYVNGAWRYLTPKEGFEIEVEDEDLSYVLRGGTWVSLAGVSELDDLSDVNAPSPTNGQVLTWDSTPGEWVSQDLPAAGAFVLGDATDVDTTGAASGNVLTYDGSQWEPAAPSGGSGWTLAGTGQTVTGKYDQAVDGSKANVDFTGLAGKTDILLVAKGVTLGVSGVLGLQVSVDNGSTWFTTSGNYDRVASTGAETAVTFPVFYDTNATAARSGAVRIEAANLAAVRVIRVLAHDGDNLLYLFDGDTTNDIDAVRIAPSGGGNITGGVIYCMAR